MIAITCDVTGFEGIARIMGKLDQLDIIMMKVVEDELWEFAKLLHSDKDIPEEYRNALAIKVVNQLGVVALTVDAPEDYKDSRIKRKSTWDYKQFSNNLEWALYRCPKRKYFGGRLTPMYNGPDFMKDRWKTYRSIFINKVKDKVISEIRKK